jgi:hypothetical protein
MKRVLLIIGLIFTLSIFAAPALAAPVLDFGTGFAGSGGILTYDGTNVSGTGIPLDVLLVDRAPQNNGVYDLSGTFVGGTNGFSAILEFDTGINSNFIRITGGVPGLGIVPDINGNYPDLLTGNIGDGFQVYQDTNKFFLAVFELQGTDVKNEALLAALGLDPATPFKFLGFNISSKNEEGVYVANSTDILNTPVPIPPAILLLGGGLAGLVVIKRRLRV